MNQVTNRNFARKIKKLKKGESFYMVSVGSSKNKIYRKFTRTTRAIIVRLINFTIDNDTTERIHYSTELCINAYEFSKNQWDSYWLTQTEFLAAII